MSVGSTLRFHDFSWRGDRKWAEATRWTLYGPIVVCFILTFSIVEIVCGSIWLLQLGVNLSVPMIIQTLLIPGCSFFNAIPSLHLHMLLRNNPPKLAMWFSSIFVIVYLASVLLSIASCAGPPTHIANSLRTAECPQGTSGGPLQGVSKPVWDTMMVFEFFSVAAYALHCAMAWKVHRVLQERKARGEVEVVDPEEEERRRQKARELWQRNYEMQGL